MTNANAEPTREAGVILRMAFAFVASQVVYQAADLGLADHLSGGALSARELAGKIGAHPDALERVLQVLVALGILKQNSDAKFELTALAEPLRSDVPNSLRAFVRFVAGPLAWRAFEQLGYSIGTGEPSFDHVWGMSNFEYWERNPDVSRIHDDAMTGLTATETARILAAYDFSAYRKIVDVGGGNGALLAAILERYREAHGVLADLPHVVSLAGEALQRLAVTDRCELVGSDFFQGVSAGEISTCSNTSSTIGTTAARRRSCVTATAPWMNRRALNHRSRSFRTTRSGRRYRLSYRHDDAGVHARRP